MSVFKDFPGLENLEKKFKDFQGYARALCQLHILKLTALQKAKKCKNTVLNV